MDLPITRDFYVKVYNCFDSLLNETNIKITRIERRQYSYDFFEDLSLKEYNKFFDETFAYVQNYCLKYSLPENLEKNLNKFYQLNNLMPLQERKYNFFSLFGLLGIPFGYNSAYINQSLEVLRGISLHSINILDCVKIQL